MDVVAPAPSQPSLRRKALTSFASFAIPVLIALIAMPILYRAMGASAFGILSIALITPTFAMSFDFGMSNAAVRRIADDLQIQSPTLGATLGGYSIALSAIGLVLGAVLALAASTLASLLGFEKTVGQDGTTLLRFCALWATITLVLALPGIVLRAQQRFAIITAVQTATTIALWLTLLMLAIYDRPIVEMVAAAILLTALTGSYQCMAGAVAITCRATLQGGLSRSARRCAVFVRTIAASAIERPGVSAGSSHRFSARLSRCRRNLRIVRRPR